jgi:4-diphosphocytidyl-2-C-methyl-D-erythritol kinase
MGGIALGAGRGDELVGVLARGGWHWVLALTTLRLSTPAVFAELDRQRAGAPVARPSIPDEALAALRAGDPVALGGALRNDLQPAAIALQPTLQGVVSRGLDAGACGALVCGSGPTTAFLVVDHHHGARVAAALTTDPIVRAVRHCTAPAPGARLAEEVIDHVEVDHTD